MMEFDSILDKIIDLTEKNLSMQGEFLKAIYELKNRFDSSDRDHKEIVEKTKITLDLSYDMLNSMKASPNVKIIEMLEDIKLRREKEALVIGEFREILKQIKDKSSDPRKIDEIADSYSLIKKILLVISIGVIGLQILFGVLNTMQNTHNNNIESAKKEFKETINKVVK